MNQQHESLEERDVAYHLHPQTNLADHEKVGPFVIERGEGIYVIDSEGNRYIEGLAGLWCTSLGFSEKRLVRAATEQLETLPYYHTFAHKATRPVIELAELLMAMAPKPLSKVFFANSGSEAVDTAVKFAWYFNNVCGRPRKKKIITRKDGYHGVTIASGSATGLSPIHHKFDLPIDRFVHTDSPHYYRYASSGASEEEFATELANSLDAKIRAEDPDTVAAFIAEPVMGAGGVIPPPATYFEKVQEVLSEHNVLLIVDEVVCGFGRTGNMFGSETYGLRPDMMTVGKALASAYQPIAATLLSDDVYVALREGSREEGIFGTGFTYSGHPVPAAVSRETLGIYRSDDILGHVNAVAGKFQERLHGLSGYPFVGDTRGVGLIGGVEFVRDKRSGERFDPSAKVAAQINVAATRAGLIVRALPNDTVGICPPLIINDEEIDDLFDRLEEAMAASEEQLQALAQA